jgi:hypothetical protein
VRQLLRNFGKVDLEVVNKDIVHGVLAAAFALSKPRNKSCQGQFGGYR